MKRHYDIDISDKLLFCKEHYVEKMTLLTLIVCIVELIVANIVILSTFLMNGIAYPMIYKNLFIFLVLNIKLHHFLVILSSTLRVDYIVEF